ncbi:Nitroreductase [Clostridium cavendishii DSM 21758]|uniref:Nitroreductase n=1 Tax=Clostridium cavendishii DSM 21758 TaxID=1121302 RepID=A0A1M6DDD0_9CLOT|nr:nitroreductase family protein [Clostridium cavendishii]SHI71051.1 Nitroreductase [Clostridium cavendishii DSM 21758]
MMNVNLEKCVGCGLCSKDCIAYDIELVNGKANIKNETCIKCGHCIAICPKEAVSTDEYDMNEVKKYTKEDFTIEAENLLNFIKFRRSVRNFNNKDVEDEKINKIIEAGRFTQTGINSQNVSYIVVKDKLQELRKLVLESLKEKGEHILTNQNITDNRLKRYAYMWIKMYSDFLENPNGSDRLFFKAPLVILVTSPDSVNASLASSNMELITNALGLGTYFSGFLAKAAEGNKKINDFLGLEENHKIVTCMVIGYPNIKYLRTVPRKKSSITWL